MKLKYCQVSFIAFNHRRCRIRKKYFNLLLKEDKKRIGRKKKSKWDIWTYEENIKVWEDFLVLEREKIMSRRAIRGRAVYERC